MDHSLFNPNQLRNYGIPFWDNPFDQERGLFIGPLDYNIVMPLQTEGTKICFLTRAPTPEELQTCIHINLTSKNDWNPTEIQLSQLSSIPGTRKMELMQFFDEFIDCPKAKLIASSQKVNPQVT